MPDPAEEAKLRFLEASARHYASSAPATSMHLMAQRDAESARRGEPSIEDRRDGICKGCGTILIPGWTSRTTIITKGMVGRRLKVKAKGQGKIKSEKRTKISGSDSLKYLKVDCLICYRFEEKPLPGLKGKIKNPPKQAVTEAEHQLPSAQTDDSPTASASQAHVSKPPTTSSSSKKRAKARKQGGLQAMLEKSKASTSPASAFGLDLLDLMKQG